MAKLINENIYLDISIGYNYIDIHQTDEYYYYLSIFCNEQPIFYIPEFRSKKKNTYIIDFELNDERLSKTFIQALTNECEKNIGVTYEGCFDLSVMPNIRSAKKSDEWVIKVSLDSLFYGSLSPARLETNFNFYTSYQSLLKFSKDLEKEENEAVAHYEIKYGSIKR
ncbi:hypothetical protein EXH44_09480 [Actinobacillus indolicus]|uniref:Uncharacterized protein n=1 Tax=Actinobacillus indolicus TaxID=51049 RepID=A0A4P7CKF8_9PAST|nr:hypothetical protein [Actinobacillus indolicus]QBQ64434.1 hypothetical protein EXH44_09480 [Actinobacillus indolicus]